MNDNRNKLRNLLDLVKEQVEIIANQKGEVPQLYLDMAKENLIKLYEEIHLLEKLKNNKKTDDFVFSKVEDPAPEIKKEVPKVVAQPKVEVSVEKKEIIVEERIEIETPKVVEETKAEIKLEVPVEIEKEVPKIKVEIPKEVKPPIEKKTAKKVLDSNDLFESQLSIGEKLQSQQEPALVDKFQKKQIEDIKSAIGINEKFLFINELFGGNMQKYNQSIEKIDCSTSKEEAVQVIEQLNDEFNWDEESEARKKLLLFIDRRY